MEKHKRNFSSRGASRDIPPFIRELCTIGGLPYEDWEALKSDDRFSQKHYVLPAPVYNNEESCESCGLIYEEEILCVACPLPKGQLTNSEMVAAAWKRASTVLTKPLIALRYDQPEHNMTVFESLIWLATLLNHTPGRLENRDEVFTAIDELPIHRASTFTSTESLCRGGVSVYTIELPSGKKGAAPIPYYVQFVGTPLTETPEPLPMSSDEAELKAVEAAQQRNAIVHHNGSIAAAKDETPVLSKKAQMRKRMKRLSAHRKR